MTSFDEAKVFEVMHGLPKGKSQIRISCACGRSADGPGSPSHLGRAVLMFQEKGWDVERNGQSAICPGCQKMTTSSPSKGVPSSNAQRMRRAAYRLLEDHFDENTGRYAPGWSDADIAEKVQLSESVVADIRNNAFALLAIDPELERIQVRVDEVETTWAAEKARIFDLIKKLDASIGGELLVVKRDLTAVSKGFKPVGATT